MSDFLDGNTQVIATLLKHRHASRSNLQSVRQSMVLEMWSVAMMVLAERLKIKSTFVLSHRYKTLFYHGIVSRGGPSTNYDHGDLHQTYTDQ